jgi:hypothetical protein
MNISRLDEIMAGVCLKCPICRRARRKQRGLAHTLVKKLEADICPFCRAYQRVYGRPAHAPRDDDQKPGVK